MTEMTVRIETIGLDRVGEDVLSAALGRNAPSRLRDAVAFAFGISRKPG
ncbi:MAG TPA: hypothetical protein PK095_17830 [Myxococcota bacterium]|nr:hypothetical protein [Myxococcota bacterium]